MLGFFSYLSLSLSSVSVNRSLEEVQHHRFSIKRCKDEQLNANGLSQIRVSLTCITILLLNASVYIMLVLNSTLQSALKAISAESAVPAKQCLAADLSFEL